MAGDSDHSKQIKCDSMTEKPTYEELEQRIRKLEKEEPERKREEKALREQMLHYRVLMDASLDGIAIIDQKHRVREANKRFAQMLGYTPEEVLGLHTWDWEAIMTEAEIRANFADLTKTKTTFETRHRRKDGTIYDAEVTACGAKLGDESMVLTIIRDITERKHVQEALRDSESRFHQLFEKMSNGVAVYEATENGEDFLFKDFNKAAEKIEQISKDELIGKSVSNVFPSVVEFGLFDVFKRVWRTGVPEHYPISFYKDERISGWRDNYVYKLPSGEIVAIYDDVTNRKRAEEDLRESEERFRIAFEDAAVGIALMANDGYFIQVNQTLCRILGYSEEELLSKTWVEITEPDDLDGCFDWLKRVKAGEQSPYEKRFVHKLGHSVWVMVSSSVARDSQDRIRYYISLFQDITSRKQAEEALRDSKERYRALFEYNPVDTIVVDNEAKIVMYNLIKEKTAGRKPEIGMVMFKDYAAKHKINMFEDLMDSIRSGNPKEFLDVNYNDRFLHIRMAPFTGGAIITSVDTTPVRKLEAQLQHSQKLESLGVLAGGIAHDFNNILTTILGNVSMARMQARPEDEMFDLLNEAEMASARAQTLTKHLLTFAKGGAPVKETASIRDKLKESSLFALRGSKSSCEFSIAEDLWPAEVDVGQISQVISNIVINANQAMPGGGIIQVAAENLIIEDRHDLSVNPGKYIKMSIKDQGLGIAEKYLFNIFDPYFTTKQEGSGLGLATTYSIIKKHDGHITVESQLGIGTTFHIYLPASDKAVSEKEEVKLIKGQGRILVMDDEASLRKIVGRMMEKLGYEPEFAKDGAEAIEMYKKAIESEKPYDVVILDLTVPGGMGGKEAISKLLEIDSDVKAIVSSGYSDDPVLANFHEYGFRGMMPKPFEPRSLSKVLHDVLKGEKE